MKYPNIKVKLTGTNGNAFAIMGVVTKALRQNDVSADEISEYQAESTSGDYNNLLQVAMKWVNVR